MIFSNLLLTNLYVNWTADFLTSTSRIIHCTESVQWFQAVNNFWASILSSHWPNSTGHTQITRVASNEMDNWSQDIRKNYANVWRQWACNVLNFLNKVSFFEMNRFLRIAFSIICWVRKVVQLSYANKNTPLNDYMVHKRLSNHEQSIRQIHLAIST